MAKRKIRTGKAWIDQIFKAKAVKKGGTLRRKKASVEKYASEKLLIDEVKRRGFNLITIGDQYLILCNKGEFKLISK